MKPKRGATVLTGLAAITAVIGAVLLVGCSARYPARTVEPELDGDSQGLDRSAARTVDPEFDGASHGLGGSPVPTVEPAFDGDSRELRETRVVLTLDAPIEGQTNLVWCASFLAAWKTLEEELVKKPLSLRQSPEVARALNRAPDPRPQIPRESLYTAAGWNQEGVTDRITKELAQRFPGKPPPTFPGIVPNSFVAYAYLEADVEFSLPYFQNRKPLVFTDGGGVETELSSFGIRSGDESAYGGLRQQPKILYVAWDENLKGTECIVDLDRSSRPNQIVVALVDPKPTLAEVMTSVQSKIGLARKERKKNKEKAHDGLYPNDVLLVPDMVWRITHHFSELEGQEFANAKLKWQRIDIAQQEIEFRLDRSGAELKSEAKAYMLLGPTRYVFDRPFLLYMKKRGADMPYFVMWVENTELLTKWTDSQMP
jgi:hypothetical protein